MNIRDQKTMLLKHYSEREPTGFLQFDGFADAPEGDDIIHPDDDKDWIGGGSTYELMHGANVRVLIRLGTKHGEALRLLKKITDWIVRDKDQFDNRMDELRKGLPTAVNIEEAVTRAKSEVAAEVLKAMEPDVSKRVWAVIEPHKPRSYRPVDEFEDVPF